MTSIKRYTDDGKIYKWEKEKQNFSEMALYFCHVFVISRYEWTLTKVAMFFGKRFFMENEK